MRIILPAVLALTLVLTPTGSASQINSLDLSALAGRADLIVLGHVTRVERVDDTRDDVTIQVADVLKGKLALKPITFRITCRGGLKDFDPELKMDERGVFFLRSVEGGGFALAFPGSVAVYPKGGNFKVTPK